MHCFLYTLCLIYSYVEHESLNSCLELFVYAILYVLVMFLVLGDLQVPLIEIGVRDGANK